MGMHNIFTNYWKEIILALFTTALVTFAYFNYKFTYWKRRGIYSVPGKIPCGSITSFILSKTSIGEIIADIYNSGKDYKYVGYYSFLSPTLVVRDLDIIKNILVKDFDNFCDRGMYYNESNDRLSGHLFALDGAKWKFIRTKLTPAFASGKMKFMFHTMKTCASELTEYINNLLNDKEDIDFKYVIARHGVNVIARTSIGIEGHRIQDDSELSRVAFKVTEPKLIQAFRFIIPMLSKDIARIFKLRFTPKEVEHYYLNLTKEIVDYRSKNNVKRSDFMQLLMEMWDKNCSFDENPNIIKENENRLTLKDLASQTFLFILAAYESNSSVICFALYELANNPDIQEKLAQEVEKAGDDLSYEELHDLKYLDMVLNEVWRKYPAAGFLFRECKNNYKLPDGKILEKGTIVNIPVLGIQRDPKYFPDPEKFDPERFNKTSPSHPIQSFSYLPFGEGPRFCIGKRYGLMQSKITLFSLVSKFKFELSKKTAAPLKIDPKTFVTQTEGGMYLKVFKRYCIAKPYFCHDTILLSWYHSSRDMLQETKALNSIMVSTSWCMEFYILLLTVIIISYGYIKYQFSYWNRKGFHHVTGKFPFGSLGDFILAKKWVAETIADIYKQGKGHKYIGYYSFLSPALVVRDLDLIKNVLVKDFQYFSNRGVYYDDNVDSLSAHLFALDGVKWKNTRNVISPAFSSGKMKLMYSTMKICALELKNYIIDLLDRNEDIIGFKYLLARHGVNVIANTAVGIEGHKLEDDSELSKIAFKVTAPDLIQSFRFTLPLVSKSIARLLKLRFTPKEVENYYLNLTKKIVDYRTKNNVVRNDFMQLLMEVWDKNSNYDEQPSEIPEDSRKLSLKDLAAETFVFILGAYETSSSTICYCLYELATNPDVQEKLIDEVDSINGDISYDELNNLPYLEMVLNETWRKHPPAGILVRENAQDYKLPDGKILEKGITTIISLYGLHRDPEHFPDPDKFDPERFNKSSPSQIVKPFSYLPFGDGPRFCIGTRFGKMQTKLTLFTLLSQFRFEISEKTAVPPINNPKIFILSAVDGMHLKVINRKKV
ncbi:uncharacterized protein LOC142321295 [Lycorma delicatula]|uniref:uncharacterized protein LOC142321295 n=1 Tax=Lycorma delicatula TaxID=130591 RepID=UPI003F51A39F